MAEKVLTLGDLNRATLARQMLLAREKTTIPKALSRLLALQAQWPKPPFIALFSRLAKVARTDLVELAQKNAVVRGTAYRATIFLMLPEDYAAFRATIQPTLDRGLRAIAGKTVPLADVDKVVAAGRALFAKGPHTFDELRTKLAKKGNAEEARHKSYVIRMRLPLLQVPTDVPWGWHAACDFALAESMLEQPIAKEPALDALVLRYLAALGPATIADAQNFTGVTGLKPAFERLRQDLVTFRDDEKKELFDLPKAPRPAANTEAPVRFLPDFDNVVMGHADRRRVIADEHKRFVFTQGLVVARTILVDGRVAGTWQVTAGKKLATLEVTPFGSLAKKARAAVEEEGGRLVRFVEPDSAAYDLKFLTSPL